MMQRYAMDATAEFGQDAWAEPRQSSIGSWVRFADAQAEIARLTAELDEARALLAILYGEEGMGNVTPADATAALARRDAAMRNEGRRQAAKLCHGMKDACVDDLVKLWMNDRGDAILATLEPESVK